MDATIETAALSPSDYARFAVVIAILLSTLAGMWATFEKAGQKGWLALIPIYNAFIVCRVSGIPPVWFLGLFIPVINLVVAILMSIGVAKNFGKGTAFGLGLSFLGFVFWPILGFGNAVYRNEDDEIEA